MKEQTNRFTIQQNISTKIQKQNYNPTSTKLYKQCEKQNNETMEYK